MGIPNNLTRQLTGALIFSWTPPGKRYSAVSGEQLGAGLLPALVLELAVGNSNPGKPTVTPTGIGSLAESEGEKADVKTEPPPEPLAFPGGEGSPSVGAAPV